jgi:O-antigen/teichoic acid export membrane protein
LNLRIPARSFALRAIANDLRSKSAFLFGSFMLANVLAYAYQMLLSRALSPANYGAMVTLTSIFYVLAVFWRAAQAWVIDAIAENGGSYASNVGAVGTAAMRWLLPGGVIVVAVHWLASGRVRDFLQLSDSTPVIVLGAYVASSFLLPIAVGLPLGLDRLYLASGVIVLEPVARLVVGLALIFLGFGIDGALLGYTAGNVVPFAVTLLVLWPLLTQRAEKVQPAGRQGGPDRYALLALATNASLMAIASIDLVVVKHYFPGEVAGNYAIAFLLGRIISMSTFSLAWVVFARSATMRPDDPGRASLLVKGLLVTGAIALILTAAYLVAPTLVTRLMAGGQYPLAAGYVGLAGIEMAIFSLAYVQAYYLISVRNMQVIWPLGIVTILEIALLIRFHSTIQQVLMILVFVMGGLLASMSFVSWRALRPVGGRVHRGVPESAGAVARLG